MEIGESVRDAIVREVLEETGLIVTVRRLIGVYSAPAIQVVRYPDGNVWHSVSVSFECSVRGGSLKTCDETLALDYFPLRRLPRHAPIASPDSYPRRVLPQGRAVHSLRGGA